jgi:hypothetical protein
VIAVSGKRTLAIALVIVVAAAVTTGIVIIGSPSEERTRRLDARRVTDLQRISQSVEVYHTRHQRVPASLDELSQEPGLAIVARDPVTGQPYGYRSIDSGGYDLCATFDQETTGVRSDFWSHGPGMQCFTLRAKQTK